MEDTKIDAEQPLLVVLGLDDTGKAHASRFSTELADKAVVAAHLMGMRSVHVTDVELKKTAMELPIGKIFATGRGFVPFVKRELYDKLAVLLDTDAEVRPSAEQRAATSAPAAGVADQPESAAAADPWAALRIGATVLAKSKDAEEGWFEAVISQIAADGNELTLRWRDFSGEPVFKVARRAVGLLA